MFDSISDKFSSIARSFSGKSKITEKNIQDAVEDIKVALLDADVNLRVVRRFINRTMEEATGETVLKSVNPGQQFIKIVYDRMVDLLGDQENQSLTLKGPDTTSVILLMGLQGSGKTTTAAKLALRLKKEGRRVMLVAAEGRSTCPHGRDERSRQSGKKRPETGKKGTVRCHDRRHQWTHAPRRDTDEGDHPCFRYTETG